MGCVRVVSAVVVGRVVVGSGTLDSLVKGKEKLLKIGKPRWFIVPFPVRNVGHLLFEFDNRVLHLAKRLVEIFPLPLIFLILFGCNFLKLFYLLI